MAWKFRELTPLILLLSTNLFAQAFSGILMGEVKGPQNDPLGGVRVSLSLEAGTQAMVTKTNSMGHFAFTGLQPGTYVLELSLAGWKIRKLAGLQMRAAGIQDLRIILSSEEFKTPGPSEQTSQRDVPVGGHFGEVPIRQFPNTPRVSSILENQEFSTVTEPLDLGGLETGSIPLFSALGGSWTENEYELNGFNITDPYFSGRPLLDPDLDSLSELDIVSAAKPAPFAFSGANVALNSPAAGTAEGLHGSTRIFYSNGSLQSDNMDSDLASLQFPGPERLNQLFDGSFHIAGKLSADRFPFFFSASTQQLSKTLGGFPVNIHGDSYNVLAKVTAFEQEQSRLDVLYAGQHFYNSNEGASIRTTPSATTQAIQDSNLIQAQWRRTGINSFWSVGFAFVHTNLSSNFQNDVVSPSNLDLPERRTSGAAPLAVDGTRTRYELNATFQRVFQEKLGSHAFQFGASYDRSSIDNRWDVFEGINQILVRGVGTQAILWNTPTTTAQHVQNFAIFAQDGWRPFSWLILPVGLRFESSSGQADGAENSVNWTNLAPRLAAMIQTGTRGPSLIGSWSRYGHVLQGRYLDFGNPKAPGAEVFEWNDANANQTAEPMELTQLISRFGGPYSAIDKNLKQPFTNEITAGLEQRLSPEWLARVRFFRRDDYNLVGLMNTGVPPSSYFPAEVLDPGNDGIPGNADDNVLTLFNRDPSSFGKDFLLLTNPKGLSASTKGFEIELLKAFGNSWQLGAGFVAMKTSGPTNPGNSVFENDTGVIGTLGTDPNTFILAKGVTFFDRGFIAKLSAYYCAPHGFKIAVVARYFDGLPFGRLLFVQGFNQGPFFVRTTPRDTFDQGGFRTEFNATLDLRVGREFRLQKNLLQINIDFFNLLNMNNNTKESDLITSPRIPLAIQAPRFVRLGLQWSF